MLPSLLPFVLAELDLSRSVAQVRRDSLLLLMFIFVTLTATLLSRSCLRDLMCHLLLGVVFRLFARRSDLLT